MLLTMKSLKQPSNYLKVERIESIMYKLLTKIVLSSFPIILVACGPNNNEMYDSGYSDGYAVGYNTTCQVRATLISDYDNDGYRSDYRDGYAEGASDCRNSDT
jgi:hypothetical protein